MTVGRDTRADDLIDSLSVKDVIIKSCGFKVERIELTTQYTRQ